MPARGTSRSSELFGHAFVSVVLQCLKHFVVAVHIATLLTTLTARSTMQAEGEMHDKRAACIVDDSCRLPRVQFSKVGYLLPRGTIVCQGVPIAKGYPRGKSFPTSYTAHISKCKIRLDMINAVVCDHRRVDCSGEDRNKGCNSHPSHSQSLTQKMKIAILPLLCCACLVGVQGFGVSDRIDAGLPSVGPSYGVSLL